MFPLPWHSQPSKKLAPSKSPRLDAALGHISLLLQSSHYNAVTRSAGLVNISVHTQGYMYEHGQLP